MSIVEKSLYQSILKSVSAKYMLFIVQLAVMMVCARWFSPMEFGVIAVITIFIHFFLMFGESGITAALITRTELTRGERNGIFSFTALLAIILAIGFYGFLYLLNSMYGRADYQLIGFYAVVTVFFSVLNTVPLASLRRDKQFIKIATNSLTGELLGLGVTFLMLQYTDPLMAIGSRYAALSCCVFILNYITSQKTLMGRPALGSNIHAIKKITSFSVYSLGFNLINHFAKNIDKILVGKFMGPTVLGLYEKVFVVMSYPQLLLTAGIAPAIQPVIVEFHSDSGSVKMIQKSHEQLLRRVSWVAFLVTFGMFTNAELLIRILLGAKWLEAVPLMEILSFAIPALIMMGINGGFWLAFDRTRDQFRVGLINSLLLSACTVTAIMLNVSLEHLTMVYVLATNLCLFQAQDQLFRLLYKVSLVNFLGSIALSVLAFASSLLVYHLLPEISNLWINLLISLIISIICFVPLLPHRRNLVNQQILRLLRQIQPGIQ